MPRVSAGKLIAKRRATDLSVWRMFLLVRSLSRNWFDKFGRLKIAFSQLISSFSGSEANLDPTVGHLVFLIRWLPAAATRSLVLWSVGRSSQISAKQIVQEHKILDAEPQKVFLHFWQLVLHLLGGVQSGMPLVTVRYVSL